MKLKVLIGALLSSSLLCTAQTVNVMFTTDVHGAIFPYDYVDNKAANHSLAHAQTFIETVRDTAKHTLLLDGGDFLQGTPTVYFYNYINTHTENIASQVFNKLKYDAVCVGNHDIETGHNVYDKVRKEINAPLLAANAVDNETGEPYFEPYKVFEFEGKKIAVIGLITPYIPHWLPEHFWSGMHFDDMIESARKWVGIVKEKEQPDAIIGLFHAGFDYTYGNQDENTYKNENASQLVATHVDGFDAVLCGHDHKLCNKTIKNDWGKEVTILDAGTGARNLGHMQMTFGKDGKLKIHTNLIALSNVEASAQFTIDLKPQQMSVYAYTKKKVCHVSEDILAYESLFGNSAFVDMVHRTMLKWTKADISFTAPLLIDTKIPGGDLLVGKTFSIYRYENMLSSIMLSGKEVKDYLEYSYDLWVANPDSTGHLLNVTKQGKLVKKFYNFDSAMGIDYTVDPFKPKGQRIEIKKMSNGEPFDMQKQYKVAINSYRLNGGGGHLEFGLGLSKEEIDKRVVESFDRDLRGLIMEDLEEMQTLTPAAGKNWRFVPEKKVSKYLKADMKLYKVVR